MSLPFVSDAVLESEVAFLLDKAREAKRLAQAQYGKNVIDPLSAMFEMAGFGMCHEAWKTSEQARQAQKTLQNHIGSFHQNILGAAKNWENLREGKVADLLCRKKRIIAEIKNKYNTVSGGRLSNLYRELDEMIGPKSSIYKDYTAYFVTIIPKKNVRRDAVFVPSDKEKGRKRAKNEHIREIDGVSFYDLVFETDGALRQIYLRLPTIIEQVSARAGQKQSFSDQEIASLIKYFESAFPV